MSHLVKIALVLFIALGAVVWLRMVFPQAEVIVAQVLQSSPKDKHRRAEIKRLASIDIDAEVDAAIVRGDYRVVGVYGYAFYCPGIVSRASQYKDYELQDILGTRAMADTSDAIESDAHRDYIEAAGRYARAYNTRLIAELARLGKLPQPQAPEDAEPR